MQHLLALRNQDISQNALSLNSIPDSRTDEECVFSPDTLYIGVLNDPSGRFGGSSQDSPGFATPHVVAFAEVQPDGQIAAHEFGHILGRLHPGIPDKRVHGRLGQTDQYELSESEKDPDPDPLGHISKQTAKSEDLIVGVRWRDGKREPEILAPNDYFDLMTYRYPKWLSKHTYEGILCRLRDIQSTHSSSDPTWLVIGQYNFNQRTARIGYVLPSELDVTPGQATLARMKNGVYPLKLQTTWLDKNGNSVRCDPVPVYTRNNPSTTDNNAAFGVFQHTIKHPDGYRPESVTLCIGDKPVHVFNLEQNRIELKRAFGGNDLVEWLKIFFAVRKALKLVWPMPNTTEVKNLVALFKRPKPFSKGESLPQRNFT